MREDVLDFSASRRLVNGESREAVLWPHVVTRVVRNVICIGGGTPVIGEVVAVVHVTLPKHFCLST